MSTQSKVSGVVLAGGQARRMNQQDKGLIAFKHQPLISYAIDALAGVTEQIVISANRNLQIYRQWGYPVVSDQRDGFDGPLAGILAAMRYTDADILLVLPCDSPLFCRRHVQRLLDGLQAEAEIAVAFDGQRLHPVFMAVRTRLQTSLADYLQQGERKLQTWLTGHAWVKVDFSDQPAVLANINTPAELVQLQDPNSSLKH